MKRIITLALAAGLFIGASAHANAAEIDVSGQWYMVGVGSDALGLSEGSALADGAKNESEFNVYQRIVVDVDITNSENLSAKIQFRAPSKQAWGAEPFNVGGGNWALDLRKAYIDWYVPTTDVLVRMGKQGFFLPTTFGSAVIDDNAAGISVVAPVNDNFAITAHWARAEDYASKYVVNNNGSTTTLATENVDLFALTAPFANDVVSVTPWIAYAMGGEASPTSATPGVVGGVPSVGSLLGESNFWVGFASEFTMFDPFTFKLGFTYGSSDDVYSPVVNDNETSGWLVDGQIEYQTAYGTPSLLGWYATGDDVNEGGRIANISSGWAPSYSAFFDQSAATLADTSGVITPTGTWALGLCWTGFEATEDLTLGAHALWINGTNDDKVVTGGFDPAYMSDEDSVVELAAFGSYDIYKDLQAMFEVNYLIADSDRDVNEENGYRAAVGFKYSF